VNASDQSEPASNSSSTDFHTEMQRALRRQGLSEVTRARYARTVRRLGARTCPFATADAMTAELRTRSLPGADFQWLLLAHVLPRGFPCATDAACRAATGRVAITQSAAMSEPRAADADSACRSATALHRKRPNAHACRGSRHGVDHRPTQAAKPRGDARGSNSRRMRGVDGKVVELPGRNTAPLAGMRLEDREVTPSASQSASHRPEPEDLFP
jgi:hypothetical protein